MNRWLPENASSYGARIDGVMELIFWIVGAWFVLVMGVLLVFALRYHHRWHERAAYVPARTLRGMAIVLVPTAVILLFDLVIETASTRVWDLVKIDIPPAAQTVRVIAKQYTWTIVHPGADNQLDTADDISELNVMHVPAGEVVHFELLSEDVIHSFFLPNFRIKQDAMPGMAIETWFVPKTAGEYEIACAEHCGLGHYRMRGMVSVVPAADLEKTLKEATAE
jgi:cytochrome c oxidase subunit 2